MTYLYNSILQLYNIYLYNPLFFRYINKYIRIYKKKKVKIRMRLQVQITTKLNLNIRSGPSTSYPIVGKLAPGSTTIVVESTTSGGYTWYRIENTKNWICHKEPSSQNAYTKTIANLEENATKPIDPAATKNDKPASNTNNTVQLSTSKKIEELLLEQGQDVSLKDIVFPLNENKQAEPTSDVNYIDDVNSRGSSSIDLSSTNMYNDPKFIQNDQSFPKYQSTNSNGIKIYNYMTDYNFIDENLKKIKGNLNVFHGNYKELNNMLFTRFNRFKIAQPEYHLTKTFAHVFITRPDLNLITEDGKLHPQVENDPIFYYLYKSNPNIILALTRHLSQEHQFHPFLSNAAGSFELSDEYIKTIEHGETLTGFKIMYGKHNIESKTAGTFNIKYVDDKDFSVFKTHKAWVEYISKVYRGELSPDRSYLVRKILDYACSAYYIMCGPDGETILFWSKYFGVFPTNVPSSSHSWVEGTVTNKPDYSITYAYAFKEDLSPLTLAEFNMNSSGDFLYKKIYEPTLLSTGKSFSGAPFIETVQGDSNTPYTFKLKFRQ